MGFVARLLGRERTEKRAAQFVVSHEPPVRFEERERTVRGNGRVRRRAETELSLARAGKSGYFKIETLEGEKIVFNVWVSPHPEHVDRRGNPMRRIFPKSYDRDGVRIKKVSFAPPGEQGPYLPIGLLYGSPVDHERFPEKHRETLELFAEGIERGVKEYNARRRARLRRAD